MIAHSLNFFFREYDHHKVCLVSNICFFLKLRKHYSRNVWSPSLKNKMFYRFLFLEFLLFVSFFSILRIQCTCFTPIIIISMCSVRVSHNQYLWSRVKLIILKEDNPDTQAFKSSLTFTYIINSPIQEYGILKVSKQNGKL